MLENAQDERSLEQFSGLLCDRPGSDGTRCKLYVYMRGECQPEDSPFLSVKYEGVNSTKRRRFSNALVKDSHERLLTRV